MGVLWVLDTATGEERAVFDPADVSVGEDELTPEERDRRERMREALTGVTAFAPDPDLTIATAVVGGAVFVVDLRVGGARRLEATPHGAFDARVDPTGRRVAFVAGGGLHVQDLDDGPARVVAAEDDPAVHWGVPEFVAAEELERHRGHWWSPDGERLAAARVDERPVQTWHISDPTDPARPPRPVRYPRAGTPNADVSLAVLGVGGSRVEVDWDRDALEYLVNVTWSERSPLTVLVMSRDQQRWQVLEVDPATGATSLLVEDRSERWLTVVTGVPDRLADGGLVFVEESEDVRRVTIDGKPVTPAGLHVDSVLDVGEDVLFTAHEEPTELHVWRVGRDGAPERITMEPGAHVAARGGPVTVVASELPSRQLRRVRVLRDGEAVAEVRSLAEDPVIEAMPRFEVLGSRALHAAVFTPGGVDPDRALPVLVDPYGGPHFARVVRAHRGLLEPQWLADQGFVVLVADGRGTPGRGVAWEHAIFRDVAAPVLEDQIDALHVAADRLGFLDLTRVGIRGWSFGGYLAALAVLRRPDVFHAAVAGAPVTDESLYDTAYTERYLGLPQKDPEVYARNSLLDDAPNLERPLLLIHGLADDNVYAANTLQLSQRLTEAGRLHSVIPLSGITHMASREAVAENLLLLELRFFREALDVDG
jgi:dipeptidyl-peptidase-4